MIFQIYNTFTIGKNITNIPFASGLYDVKILRCDTLSSPGLGAFWNCVLVMSDTLPFNTITYTPYAPLVNRRLQNVKALAFDMKNSNITTQWNTSFENSESNASYEYKNVLITNQIDFTYYASGLGNLGVAQMHVFRQPPVGLAYVLLTLDITPSKQEQLSIMRPLASSNLYQSIISFFDGGVSRTDKTFIPFYGPCKLTILRIDTLLTPSLPATTLFKLTSPDINTTAGNNTIVFHSNTDFSTAYYGSNLSYDINTTGELRLTISRYDGGIIGFSAGFLVSFMIDKMY